MGMMERGGMERGRPVGTVGGVTSGHFPPYSLVTPSHCIHWSLLPTVLTGHSFPPYPLVTPSHCIHWSLLPTVLTGHPFPLYYTGHMVEKHTLKSQYRSIPNLPPLSLYETLPKCMGEQWAGTLSNPIPSTVLH